MFRTLRGAATSWRRNAKPAVGRCLADVLRRELAKEGIAFRVISAGPRPFPAVAPRTAAWRVSGRITVDGTSAPLLLDAIALSRGRVITALVVLYDRSQPAAAEVRRLARVLAGRMR